MLNKYVITDSECEDRSFSSLVEDGSRTDLYINESSLWLQFRADNKASCFVEVRVPLDMLLELLSHIGYKITK